MCIDGINWRLCVLVGKDISSLAYNQTAGRTDPYTATNVPIIGPGPQASNELRRHGCNTGERPFRPQDGYKARH